MESIHAQSPACEECMRQESENDMYIYAVHVCCMCAGICAMYVCCMNGSSIHTCMHTCKEADRQTDGQTDRQTDRQTDMYHIFITGGSFMSGRSPDRDCLPHVVPVICCMSAHCKRIPAQLASDCRHIFTCVCVCIYIYTYMSLSRRI